MKEILQKLKVPIIVMAVLGLIFVLYYTLVKKPDDGELIQKKTSNESLSASFLPILLQIKDIKFNTDFFNDKVFLSLKDFGQKIIEEERERTNPFAPISAVSASSTVEGLGFEDTDGAPATSTAPARSR